VRSRSKATELASVGEELRDAAAAIRRSAPTSASFHREVATLLDQIALSAPLVEMQLPPITRKALAVARAFQRPAPVVDDRMCQYCGENPAVVFDVDGAWCDSNCQRNDRGNEETWWRKAVQP
jgi:hypothetical protein